MALSAGLISALSSRILKKLHWGVTNEAPANATVATNDVVLTFDQSNNYEPSYSTVAQLSLAQGGGTAGTVTASDIVVVDANKDIATFRNLSAVNLNASTAVTATSASAVALAVGLGGATNPAFVVDSSTGSQAAGLKVTGAATGGTVAVAAIDSGSNTNLTINGKGTGTIGIGSVSTGAVTITPATTITGAVTPTGGIAAAGGLLVSPRLMHTGRNPPSVSTDFSDYTVVATETIKCEIFVDNNCSSTGVALFNGSAVAGNVKAFLTDSAGNQITGVLTASTAQSGTDAYQLIPWAGGPYTLKGPATYWLAVQGDTGGGTSKINTHTIGAFGAGKQTGTVYGTLTVAAAPTTFTTALGPVATLY